MKKKILPTQIQTTGSTSVEPIKEEPIDMDLLTRQIAFLTYYYSPVSEGHLNKFKAARLAGFSADEANNLDTSLDSILGEKMKEMTTAFTLKGINPLTIADMHKMLLEQKEKRVDLKTGDVYETGNIDVGAVTRALDMIHKIRGDYAPEKIALGLGIASIKEILEEVQNENE